MKILYADDDADDQDFFAKIIAEIDSDIQVVQAVDGLETLILLATGVLPDLIFLDINMPKLNGEETLKIIRKDPRLKNTKVIIYSTSINKNSIPRYNALNAKFLTKPFTMHDGVAELKMLITENISPELVKTK